MKLRPEQPAAANDEQRMTDEWQSTDWVTKYSLISSEALAQGTCKGSDVGDKAFKSWRMLRQRPGPFVGRSLNKWRGQPVSAAAMGVTRYGQLAIRFGATFQAPPRPQ